MAKMTNLGTCDIPKEGNKAQQEGWNSEERSDLFEARMLRFLGPS